MASEKAVLRKAQPPAPKPRGKYNWDQVADELRDSPGEWFLIAEMGYSGMITHLRNGRIKAFRQGRWEFESRSEGRSTKNPKWSIYGRFLGDK